MTQAVNFTAGVCSAEKTQKNYAVSFKGLIAHAKDVFRQHNVIKVNRSLSDLPDHIKRDIGLIR